MKKIPLHISPLCGQLCQQSAFLYQSHGQIPLLYYKIHQPRYLQVYIFTLALRSNFYVLKVLRDSQGRMFVCTNLCAILAMFI